MIVTTKIMSKLNRCFQSHTNKLKNFAKYTQNQSKHDDNVKKQLIKSAKNKIL